MHLEDSQTISTTHYEYMDVDHTCTLIAMGGTFYVDIMNPEGRVVGSWRRERREEVDGPCLVRGVKFLPVRDKYVLAVATDNGLYLLEIRLRATFGLPLRWEGEEVREEEIFIVSLSFTPLHSISHMDVHMTQIAVAMNQDGVALVNFENLKSPKVTRGKITSTDGNERIESLICVDKDVASVNENGSVCIWDMSLTSTVLLPSRTEGVASITWLHRTLAVSLKDGSIMLWSHTGSILAMYPPLYDPCPMYSFCSLSPHMSLACTGGRVVQWHGRKEGDLPSLDNYLGMDSVEVIQGEDIRSMCVLGRQSDVSISLLLLCESSVTRVAISLKDPLPIPARTTTPTVVCLPDVTIYHSINDNDTVDTMEKKYKLTQNRYRRLGEKLKQLDKGPLQEVYGMLVHCLSYSCYMCRGQRCLVEGWSH